MPFLAHWLYKNQAEGEFPVVQWLRLHTPNIGGPDLIPGQRPRSHMLQPRVHKLQPKTLNAAMKIEDPMWCS